ncbi:MAG: type II toxin-antitoxin system RelE/ParE family toxin [Dethiobacter sp.]|jgi:plasmid stabilization system protein ParE|nr:type II toxin-antitoxin system RelE/ParE family toxin [Dethiobacter sp.]
MTVKVLIRLEAEQDIADAAVWYEAQQHGLGHKFLDEIHAMLFKIAESPLIYPIVYKNTRRAFIRRFPFGVYYWVENLEIVVMAVMHGSRNPRNWKNRI